VYHMHQMFSKWSVGGVTSEDDTNILLIFTALKQFVTPLLAPLVASWGTQFGLQA